MPFSKGMTGLMVMQLVQTFRRRFWRWARFMVLTVVSCWLVVGGLSMGAYGAVGNDVPMEVEASMAQGRALFAAGRLAEAADIWQQAAKDYAAQGQTLERAKALHYLALTDFNLGRWELAQQANTESQTQLRAAEPSLLGASLNLQGQLQLVGGQPEQAIETWKQAAAAYASANDTAGQLGAQLNQARALQTLGHYQQSQQQLEQSLAMAQAQTDPVVKATSLNL
ncbi:MAG: hypothetical protein AAGF93_17820, partial [Cyanobacteria bacterium P01_H01_bin.105]